MSWLSSTVMKHLGWTAQGEKVIWTQFYKLQSVVEWLYCLWAFVGGVSLRGQNMWQRGQLGRKREGRAETQFPTRAPVTSFQSTRDPISCFHHVTVVEDQAFGM